MKNTIITLIAILAILFGTANLNDAHSQVYIFYDPMEMEDPDIEITECSVAQDSITSSPLVVWIPAALWCVIVGVVMRARRIQKNKERRERMEHGIRWYTHRSAATMGLMLLLAMPAKAQIYMDAETAEYNQRLNAPGNSMPIIPVLDSTLDQYAPLGGGLLVLGVLGGAYLLGRRRKNTTDE